MDDERERVDPVAGEQDVELHEVGVAVAERLVVERRVAGRARLELVVEVEDDLGERQVVADLDPLGREVVEVDVSAAPALAELHDGADVRGWRDERRADVRLGDALDRGRVGHVGGASDLDDLPRVKLDLVADVRGRREELEVVLALESLAHDVHVQKAEEPATEAEARARQTSRARRRARRR